MVKVMGGVPTGRYVVGDSASSANFQSLKRDSVRMTGTRSGSSANFQGLGNLNQPVTIATGKQTGSDAKQPHGNLKPIADQK